MHETPIHRSWSRVSKHLKTACGRNRYQITVRKRLPPTIPGRVTADAEFDQHGDSMLASSSHMEGISKLGGDLQDFGQGFPWERAVECLIDVYQ
jgi:hypothetical protein